jgi:predicted kinase
MSSTAGTVGRGCAGPRVGVWTADQLDTRVRQGRLGTMHLDALARSLVCFHAGSAPDGPLGEARSGGEGLAERVLHRARALRAVRPDLEAAIDSLVSGAEHVRNGATDRPSRPSRRLHGALELARIHVTPGGGVDLGPPVLGLAGDPARDVAALKLQLAVAGHPELAERWLAAYARTSGDWALYRGIDLHEWLAALENAATETAVAEGRAEAWLRTARCAAGASPRLVAVGGAAASGRSRLAAELGEGLGAPVLGARSGDPGTAALEGPRPVEPDLSQLVAHADGVLASGRPLVIDAALATVRERAALRALAGRRQVPVLFIECRPVPSPAQGRRIARPRDAAVSDEAAAARDLAAWEAVAPSEFGRGEYFVADASRPSAACLARALGAAGMASGSHRSGPRVLRVGPAHAPLPPRRVGGTAPRA